MASALKVQPYSALYMEIPKGPLACGNCMMWIKDIDRCMIHPKDVKVTGDMICALYINGEPSSSEDAEPEGYVTPKVSGLGEGNTSCGNCNWGGGPNCLHPALSGWKIDNKNGCCNAWYEIPEGGRLKPAEVEVLEKTEPQLEEETANKWADRAIACYKQYAETDDTVWLDRAKTYSHEAVEHAAFGPEGMIAKVEAFMAPHVVSKTVEKVWSDEAREAALEARRRNAAARQETPAHGAAPDQRAKANEKLNELPTADLDDIPDYVETSEPEEDERVETGLIFGKDVDPDAVSDIFSRIHFGQGWDDTAEPESVNIKDLAPSQTSVSRAGVKRYLNTTEGLGEKKKPIVARDPKGRMFIVDGHHRLAASALAGRTKADVMVIDIDNEGKIQKAIFTGGEMAAGGGLLAPEQGRFRDFLKPMLRKAANHGGIMVCLRVPPDIAADLAVPDGEEPEDLHITLAYLGDADQADPDALAELAERLKAVALYFEPLAGRVSGYGRFLTGDEDVIYASFDSPELAELRRAIAEMCAWSLLPPVNDHGFQPHITLAYVAPGEGADMLEAKDTPEIEFDRLQLVIAGRIVEYGFLEKSMDVTGGGSGDGDSFGLHDRAAPVKKPRQGTIDPHEGVLEKKNKGKQVLHDEVPTDEEQRKKPTKYPQLAPDITTDIGKAEDEGGRWVTIRGNPVFINDEGVITRGPKALVGKKPEDVGKEPKDDKPAFDPRKGPIETKRSIPKHEQGDLAESIVQDFLGEDTVPLNKPDPGFPIDMMQKNDLIEIKGGVVSAVRGAQQWRVTFSLSPGQQAELKRMPKAAQVEYRFALQKATLTRKETMLKELEKTEGKKFNKVTMAVIMNPDTKTADIYRFKGWHKRIGWKDDSTRDAYVGTVTYGER